MRRPMGPEKEFTVANVQRWMRGHAQAHPALSYLELAAAAQEAFDVTALMQGWEPGDHFVWDVAIEVLGSTGLAQAVAA